MLSAGLPENLGAVGWVRWRVLGGSQFHGGGGGGRKKRGRQLHSAHPSGTVLPHKKSSELGGVDVDYKGGASCRRADVGGLWGRKSNSVGSRFQFCS